MSPELCVTADTLVFPLTGIGCQPGVWFHADLDDCCGKQYGRLETPSVTRWWDTFGPIDALTQETDLCVWFMNSSTVAALGHVPGTVAQLLRVFTSPQLETPRYDIIAIFRWQCHMLCIAIVFCFQLPVSVCLWCKSTPLPPLHTSAPSTSQIAIRINTLIQLFAGFYASACEAGPLYIQYAGLRGI